MTLLNSTINPNKPTVIWDWNGTLINDTDICVESMNPLLRERELELLTKERYREVFTFPVKEYYEKVGFNFKNEPFKKSALEFMDNYNKLLPSACLFTDVIDVLKRVKQLKYNQVIVSAMEEELLKTSVHNLGITKYFDTIAGITDHFATRKTERGRKLIDEFKLDSKKMIFIGDTLHDKEVADDLGCKCILVSNGHQSVNRLNRNGNMVVNSLGEVLNLIQNHLQE